MQDKSEGGREIVAKQSNRERILQLLHEDDQKRTAEEIAQNLGIQRNTASGILNDLVREGKVQKEKTRPVRFSLRQNRSQEINDPFYGLIGADQSLKDAVEKCKLSAGYPQRGMPILIFGDSGVGKSLLAEYIYRYAKFIGAIPKDAPFVVLNCADYANNKELLSSVLFGYKKGTFTGANKDTKGLIEEADSGYLFLDEVHRLSPEGQEKLFRYMDKGIVSRMGESGQDVKLNVRLIFATTEGRETMLGTFLRRIPVDVTLPTFQERTLEEKYQLILFLIHQEAVTMNCHFAVSSNVLNRVLTFQGQGNIGTLKNILRLTCAKAYNEKKPGEEKIPVRISHLSQTQFFREGNEFIPYVNQSIEISPTQNSGLKLLACEQSEIDFSDEIVVSVVVKYLKKDISTGKFRQIIYNEVNRVADLIISQDIHPYIENLYSQAINKILIYLRDNYGLKHNGVMEMVFVKLLYVLNNQDRSLDDKKYEKIAEQLQAVMYRSYKMGLIFYELIHQAVDYETNPWFVRVFSTLYFYSITRDDMDYTNAIIVSHGPATASSIASTVNKVFETYVFEAFDMTYDTPKKEVAARIKMYLKNTNTSKGLLIFVDMGSLLDISEDLKDAVEGDLGIVNNITTEMAMEAAERILAHEDLQDLMDNILEHHVTKKRYVPSRQKAKAIVLCCTTGLGATNKMKVLLEECLEGMDISVVEIPYAELKEKGGYSAVFCKYDVQFVVTTTKLELGGMMTLMLNELIEERGEKVIYSTVGKYFEKEKIQHFIENIVRSFTIRNLIGQLTILNPDKIMADVEDVVARLEILEGTHYPMDLRKMLYIHMCVMVERLILEKGQLSESDLTQEIKCRESFVKNLKESFSVIEHKYNVSMNDREILMIYHLAENI